MMEISTHTPVRVWHKIIYFYFIFWKFQLTHPWGCDKMVYSHWCGVVISTHTPVRVWPLITFNTVNSLHFNSHTREGVTVNIACLAVFKRFQLTHPWGCDLFHLDEYCPSVHFNSHTREGVTVDWLGFACWFLFQLTHPWGCDLLQWAFALASVQFQLTHPWGCDSIELRADEGAEDFNSHTREGVTQQTQDP